MAGTTDSKARHYGRADTRWLVQRGRSWYAILEVPRPLQASLGKRRFLKSLGTRDFHVALSRRHAALAEFQRAIEAANGGKAADNVMTAALGWRQTFQAFDRGDFSGFHTDRPDGQPGAADNADKMAVATMLLADDAEDIAAEHGPAAASIFVGVARGTATPILLHVDDWLREGGAKGPLNKRTQDQYRSDLDGIEAWARSVGAATVEAITPAMAGRYVTGELVAKGVHWATGNRKISAASSYWRWLRKRAGVTGNPWAGQSLARTSRRIEGERKRPFTDAEVAVLLAGKADPELADAMRIAALSGMRLEELFRLTVADCAGGWFRVRVSKTPAGRRRVPIHSALAGIVAVRLTDKAPDAFLFHETGEAKAGRERSASLSQRFGRYRQAVGVHDRAEGVRHSRVDFHSWRRWFITAARNAGTDRAVVAAVVGHETGTLTDDTYHGGPSEALLRACVEAVQLPPPPSSGVAIVGAKRAEGDRPGAE